MVQPTIKPLFDTLQFQDVMLNLLESPVSFYDEIKNNWNNTVLNGSSWNQALHDGIYVSDKKIKSTFKNRDLSSSVKELLSTSTNDFELTLYPKISIGDGQQANNPYDFKKCQILFLEYLRITI